MSVDQDILDFSDARRSGVPVIGMHPMQQASRRISEFREGRSALKAKDLVGLLLCHGARAWRASQPVAHARLRVRTPQGSPAIRLRFR
jgi:hypothetical protein